MIFRIYLSNWGEPLLSKELPEMVRIARRAGCQTFISSNLSLPLRDDYLADLMQAKPTHLKIGLDGFTTEVLRQYRRGADAELAKKNLLKLVELNRTNGGATCIHVQYHLFKHNVEQVEITKQFCSEHGVSFGVSKQVFVPSDIEANIEAALPELNNSVAFTQKVRSCADFELMCSWLYHCLVFSPDGVVEPCCAVVNKADAFLREADPALGNTKYLLTSFPFQRARDYFRINFQTAEDMREYLIKNVAELDGMDLRAAIKQQSHPFVCSRCSIGPEIFRFTRFPHELLLDALGALTCEQQGQKTLLLTESNRAACLKLIVLLAADVMSYESSLHVLAQVQVLARAVSAYAVKQESGGSGAFVDAVSEIWSIIANQLPPDFVALWQHFLGDSSSSRGFLKQDRPSLT